ncbi:MAG: CBS domain-containing protein [Eggerthellaceae bacterium]|nr:CBS domain-containing protein [Eggerthellaceae bacterium]
MRDSLSPFVIEQETSLVDAFRAIDGNKSGFVIVADDDGHVLGTLTDGDIRRAIIAGVDLSASVSASKAYRADFIALSVDQGIDDAIDIFKQGAIDFIPVLDGNGRLANVLQKKQLYSLLLQCENASLGDDFSSVDGSLIDFEVFNRPWGIYKTTVLQDKFQSKILQVKPKSQLSLQYHNYREEYWTVESGMGVAQVGESRFALVPGSSVVIPRGCKHRLINTSETEYLVVSEVQIGDYFGEDDIVRIEDDYGRAGD